MSSLLYLLESDSDSSENVLKYTQNQTNDTQKEPDEDFLDSTQNESNDTQNESNYTQTTSDKLNLLILHHKKLNQFATNGPLHQNTPMQNYIKKILHITKFLEQSAIKYSLKL